MTCSAYSVERTEAAEATLALCPTGARLEIELHLQALRNAPLPAVDNGIRLYRGMIPDLPSGFEGPFWAKTKGYFVFHAVHSRECRVVLLWVFPESSLEIS